MTKIELNIEDKMVEKISEALLFGSGLVLESKDEQISHIRFFLMRELSKLILRYDAISKAKEVATNV